MTDLGNFKKHVLECIRLANECLHLAEQVQSPEVQIQLGQVAQMLVEAAGRLRPKP